MIKKIIAGSQTGVNRAVLDVALGKDVPCAGWCPKGRLGEDGVLPKRYPLQEAKFTDERIPTEMNVIEADGTLILTRGRPTGCTALAEVLSRRHAKPLLVIDLLKIHNRDMALSFIRKWIDDKRIEILNVTGPRESRFPGIYLEIRTFMEALIDTR
jgi:hypothetical protein